MRPTPRTSQPTYPFLVSLSNEGMPQGRSHNPKERHLVKEAKSLLPVAALAMGLGIGFGVSFAPTSAQAQQGAVECADDYPCDERCGAVGAGACYRGRCGCRF